MKTQKTLSVLLKTVVTLCSFAGVLLTTFRSSRGFMAGGRSLLFFTVQSNLWIGIVCLAGIVLLLCRTRVRRWMYVTKLVFTVSITLTGFVYCFMLAPLFRGAAWGLSSTLMHLAVPVAAVLDFLIWDTRYRLRLRDCLWCTLPPIWYLCFAAAGYLCRWDFGGANYPYFFLNWGSPAGAFGIVGEFPYLGVVYYVLLLLGFILLTAAVFVLLSHWRTRKTGVHQ